MSLYRIYIDEVGNPDLTHVDDPNHRFLSLTGVILESEYAIQKLLPEMDQIKREFFQYDPDEPVIFHRKKLVNKQSPFHPLINPDTEKRFNAALLTALASWEYAVITVVIDKRAYRDQYQVWYYHPYHYCLSVLLERFVLFLHYGGHCGDVMIEGRVRQEDGKLKDLFSNLYARGTDNVPPQRWQRRLTSRELKIKLKSADIAGLQLADMIAHPSRREVLIEQHLVTDDRDIFGDEICVILNQSKYYRHRQTGQIEGFGKKLLP